MRQRIRFLDAPVDGALVALDDAIDEVRFDAPGSLVRRVGWFAARPVPDPFVDPFSLHLR